MFTNVQKDELMQMLPELKLRKATDDEIEEMDVRPCVCVRFALPCRHALRSSPVGGRGGGDEFRRSFVKRFQSVSKVASTNLPMGRPVLLGFFS